jgi:D-3-phosphoglycerate dehydrogenase / 2-oxoglutarate reductase
VPRVLITPVELLRRRETCHELLLEAGFEIVYPPVGVKLYDEQRLIDHLAGVDAMLAGMEPLTARVLQSSTLKVVARFGVGYDAIDVPAATGCKIAVTITPGANQVSVAEHTLALILGVLRGFPARDQAVREGTWIRPPLARLAGKTLGLLGVGRIGKEVVPRAQAFGVKLIAYDPQPDTEFFRSHDVDLVEFDQLFAQADIVSLHLPCTSKTTKIINASAIAKMRRGAILINTARGGLVDEEALVDALERGHLWGAGLDAFAVEPLSTKSRLLQLPNVLLTPHAAGLDHDSVIAMGLLAAECIVKLYAGDAIPHGSLVNSTLERAWNWKVTK